MTFKELFSLVGGACRRRTQGPGGDAPRGVGRRPARTTRGRSMDQTRRGSARRAGLVRKVTVCCPRRPSTSPHQSSDAQHFLRLFLPSGKASQALTGTLVFLSHPKSSQMSNSDNSSPGKLCKLAASCELSVSGEIRLILKFCHKRDFSLVIFSGLENYKR